MEWRELILSRLPPLRDDEPVSLRESIVAELQDHLELAFRRELLREADPVRARQQVLEAFGNPADIAYQLWLDALKGTLLMNRILVATTATIGVACCLMVALMWNLVSAQAERSDSQIQAMLTQTQMFMEQMQENNRAGDEEVRYSGPVPNWEEFELTLLAEAIDEQQLAENNYQIDFHSHSLFSDDNRLTSQAFPSGSIGETLTLKAGESYKFGMLPWGYYTMLITTDWNESCYQKLFLGPGRGNEAALTVPISPPEQFPVVLNPTLAEQLAEKQVDQLLLRIVGEFEQGRVVDGKKWSLENVRIDVTMDLEGKVLSCVGETQEIPKAFQIREGRLCVPPGKYAISQLAIRRQESEKESLYSWFYKLRRPPLLPEAFSVNREFYSEGDRQEYSEMNNLPIVNAVITQDENYVKPPTFSWEMRDAQKALDIPLGSILNYWEAFESTMGLENTFVEFPPNYESDMAKQAQGGGGGFF